MTQTGSIAEKLAHQLVNFLALARFEARVYFINNVNTTLAANQAVSAVTALERFE